MNTLLITQLTLLFIMLLTMSVYAVKGIIERLAYIVYCRYPAIVTNRVIIVKTCPMDYDNIRIYIGRVLIVRFPCD